MNFEDERYVRRYVRKTLTWKMLKWQGRFVFQELWAEVDRAGVLDLTHTIDTSDLLIESLAELLDMPPDIVKVGLAKCIELGCVQLDRKRLFIPRFMAAQEARQSDRQRQRESRARRRELAALGEGLPPALRDNSSQNVTDENGSFRDMPSQNVTALPAAPVRDGQSQDVTQPATGSLRDGLSHNVTSQPDSGQNVTPYCTKLNLNSGDIVPASADGARLAIKLLCDSAVDHTKAQRIAAGSSGSGRASGRVVELMRRMLARHPCKVAELQRMGELVAQGEFWGFSGVLTISTLCRQPDLTHDDHFEQLLILARTPARVLQTLPKDDPRRFWPKKRTQRPAKPRSPAKTGESPGKKPSSAPGGSGARRAEPDPAGDAARRQLGFGGPLS